MVKPWADAGFECWCVDTQHSIRRDRTVKHGAGVIHYVWGDARSWRLPTEARGRVAIGFGFTPCTHLTSSDARDFKKKAGWMLADAVQLFDSVEMAFSFGGFPYMLENPIGRLNTHRRAPDHKFQPWEYGDLWTKQTALWTGNGFRMPPPKHSRMPEGVTQKIWEMPPSDERDNLRSETPPGFAMAVFQANAFEPCMKCNGRGGWDTPEDSITCGTCAGGGRTVRHHNNDFSRPADGLAARTGSGTVKS